MWDRIIEPSDDEHDSDSSLEELSTRLQYKNTAKHASPRANGSESSRNTRVRNRGKVTTIHSPPPKPKYKFTMEALIKQAESHKAAEESARSTKALLENTMEQKSQYNSPEAARDRMLKSVVDGKEGTDVDKILQAVKRTEAIRSEKKWYFFDIVQQDTHADRQLPMNAKTEGWKTRLADPRSREQTVLSGFARDMVGLGDTLSDETLLWMLKEICLEHQDDMREAYCKILAASSQQLRNLLCPTIIISLFKALGGTDAAVKTDEKVKPMSADYSPYENHDWTALRAVITFVGQISEHLSLKSCEYTFCLLLRLCIDGVFVEDLSLLAALQKTMEQVSENIGVVDWEQTVREKNSEHTLQG
jgi:hypothetical protein